MFHKIILLCVSLACVNAGFFDHIVHKIGGAVKDIGDAAHDVGKGVVNAGKGVVDAGKGVVDIVEDGVNTALKKKIEDVDVEDLKVDVCGGNGDVKLRKFKITPNPIHLPGDFSASFDISLRENITSPISASLDIRVKKKPFGWIDIPCKDGMGSCSYDDICQFASKGCPKGFAENGLPCSCPLTKGRYVLPASTFSVDDISLPPIAEHGDYEVKARLQSGGSEILCLKITFSM